MTRLTPVLVVLWLALAGCSGGGAGSGGGGGVGGAVSGAFNADIAIPQSTPQLARDAAGRTHLLSGSPMLNALGKTQTRYGVCASGCDSAAAWSFLTLDETTALDSDVKLAVEPGGRVHVVELFASSFRYATCPSSCATLASWTAVDVAFPAGFSGLSLPVGRSFAVSSAGKPRLLLNAYAGAGPQVFLLGCDGTCTDGTGWRVDPLVNGKASAASMTPGEPHQAVLALDLGFQMELAECASLCGGIAGWTLSPLWAANSNFVSLVRGAGGELNLAYKSSLTVSADQTLYGRCTSQCGQVASWTVTEAERGANGRGGLDLAVSSTGTLAIAEADAVNEAQQLRWVTCAGSCTQPASWAPALLESGAAVKDPYSTLPGFSCTSPVIFWAVGTGVQLVPSSTAGAFQLAYDATNYDLCPGVPQPAMVRASTIRLDTRAP